MASWVGIGNNVVAAPSSQLAALHTQAIFSGQLVPVSTVRLGPGGRMRLSVVAAITGTELPVKLKKFDATLSIRLAEFARDLQVCSKQTRRLNICIPPCPLTLVHLNHAQIKSPGAQAGTAEDEVPVREIPVVAKVCSLTDAPLAA